MTPSLAREASEKQCQGSYFTGRDSTWRHVYHGLDSTCTYDGNTLGLVALAGYIGLLKGTQGLRQGESTLARGAVLGGGDNEVAKGGHKGWHSYSVMKTKS